MGPYELHDFFLYYAVRWGFSPRKVFRLALYALGDQYDRDILLRWLENFYRRFFAQQSSCSGLRRAKVGTLTLSPGVTGGCPATRRLVFGCLSWIG